MPFLAGWNHKRTSSPPRWTASIWCFTERGASLPKAVHDDVNSGGSALTLALAEILQFDERAFDATGPNLPQPALLVLREALIQEIVHCCEVVPAAAALNLSSLRQLAVRSAVIHSRWRERRDEMAKIMMESIEGAETQLRQLRSFQEPTAADASLLDRLA